MLCGGEDEWNWEIFWSVSNVMKDYSGMQKWETKYVASKFQLL